jgi:transposase InsO family protein
MIQPSTDDGLSVEAVCEALDVSVSGYYAWRDRDPSGRQQADKDLGQAIMKIFHTSRQTYGSHRVYQALRQAGVRTSRKRVARLMRTHGLRSVRAVKRRISLTRAGSPAFIAPNRLNQDFRATRPNEKWVTDTTYIPTREGWLYLVSVMDLYSRQVVGWAMGQHHDACLATSALNMAVQRQRPTPGLIVHSDRGGEFANARFQARAAQAHIQLSMSSTGNCYDNAAAESFFATVKLEAVRGQVFVSRAVAHQELFDFIEVFYNRQRLHSGCHYTPPVSRVA